MSAAKETPKEVATRLAATATTRGVRFPKVWDQKQILQQCFSVLSKIQDCEFKLSMLRSCVYTLQFWRRFIPPHTIDFKSVVLFKEEGIFDEEGAINNLIETYGQEKEVVKIEEGGKKKRKAKESDEGPADGETETVKKVKAIETVLVRKIRITLQRII